MSDAIDKTLEQIERLHHMQVDRAVHRLEAGLYQSMQNRLEAAQDKLVSLLEKEVARAALALK